MNDCELLLGDCRPLMDQLPENHADACLTDPPYELSFMGESWDSKGVAFDPATWACVLRVLKPGGFLAAFGGSRTWHRLACAIEDAGFEIRDSIMWVYAQGFPKHNAQLKPAFEPIVVARKPFRGSLAANLAAHGTGAMNIDACRVPMSAEDVDAINAKHAGMDVAAYERPKGVALNLSVKPMKLVAAQAHPLGRWPSNMVLDGSPEVDAGFEGTAAADGGPVARYFFHAKATKADRGPGNTHKCVKPTALMRYLARLVTPPGGLVLDPFMGSGTTGVACLREGFRFLGMEEHEPHLRIARARVEAAWAEAKAA